MRHPAMRLAERQRAHQARTYAYLFTWPSPFMGGILGACHALELPFVFGTLGHPLLRPFAGKGPAAEALAARIQDAWLAFARSGDPSHGGLGTGPPTTRPAGPPWCSTASAGWSFAPREPERVFWDSAGRGLGGYSSRELANGGRASRRVQMARRPPEIRTARRTLVR